MFTTKKAGLAVCIATIMAAPTMVYADETADRVAALEQQLEQLKSDMQKDKGTIADKVKIGGALRYNYAHLDYNDAQKDRGGDLDFDVFRLNIDGREGSLYYSAEYRWYQYMDVVHHLYLGYDFDEQHTIQAGVTQVPFGNLTWASHNFFFTSGFYLGLEDDYDLGINYRYRGDKLDFDFAFYKNDEQGGVDGYVSDRSDRYSYDVVGIRLDGEGTYDAPTVQLGESNTFNARIAYDIVKRDGLNIELGASAQFGQLEGSSDNMGDHYAYAAHSVIDYERWQLQLQYASYEYDLDDYDVDSMVVGAYAFYDSIPTEADTYSVNVAYTLPVDWYMVDSLTFYNDYSAVTDKSTNTPDTRFNATGVMVAAGGLYVYVDYYIAENQPFVNGTMVGDNDEKQKRLNVNIGYYF